MNYLIIFVIVCIAQTILHETGHYILAFHYGRKPRFGFRIKGINTGAIVQFSIPTIHNGKELKSYFNQQVKIAQAGLLGNLAPIAMIIVYPDLIALGFAFILVTSTYSCYEVGTSIITNELEKIGDLTFKN